MTALTWVKPDEYHIRSACGRFSVARLNVLGTIWYVAFKLPWGESSPSTELGATHVSSGADDDERKAAIHEMQQLCEAAA